MLRGFLDEIRVQLGLRGEKRLAGGDVQPRNGKRHEQRQGGWPGCVSGRASGNSLLHEKQNLFTGRWEEGGAEGGVMPPWKKRDTSEEVDETASGVKMARQNL